MSALAQIAEFTDSERRLFEELLRKFLGGRCYQRGRRASNADAVWRFLMKHRSVFAEYFACANWEFEVREDLGAAVARPRSHQHAVHFTPLMTHFAYTALLVHHEATQALDLDPAPLTMTFGEFRERLEATLPPGVKIKREGLQKAWRSLAKFGAIDLSPGFRGDALDEMTVLPVIEMILPPGALERQIRPLAFPELGAADVDLVGLEDFIGATSHV